jgi:adenylate kinase
VRTLLAGAPGAGKGTQGNLLARQLGVPHLISGDILRDHIARATPEGVQARAAVERGDLVSNELVLRMLSPTLERAGRSGGFVLDGYPRTLAQARHVEDSPARLDVVVHLLVPRGDARHVLPRRATAHGRRDRHP